ncbi:MAG: 50S ribosomal protein L4 [Pseudomonadota bacterium]
MKTIVTTLQAASDGEVSLSDDIFGLEPRADILQRMVRYQQLKKMAGTHFTKDRSQVTTTKKKSVRQKGSGGARHGNKAAPQFRGGGKAFGPKPRSHAIGMPKRVRALALKHALSAKAKAGEMVVLDQTAGTDGKTKTLKSAFSKLGWSNALIIDGREIDVQFALGARNIPNIDVLPVQGINVYDVLRRHTLVLTKSAVAELEERLK